jgi:hypothetical protein
MTGAGSARGGPVTAVGWVRVAAAVVARPRLWGVAAGQARRLAPPRWWAQPPFLPVPDRAYLRFRLMTAYGGEGRGAPEPSDVVAYLGWCRSWRGDLGG